MGSENTILTCTTSRNNRKGISFNSNSITGLAPSSIYQFGIVTTVNPTTKEIIYNIIENNVASQKLGKALPLYKNKIQLPGIGYIVPLLRGPSNDVSAVGGQYAKTTYYMDPIGIWQTVEDNKVERTNDMSPEPTEVKISKLDIKNIEIGISNNQPSFTKEVIFDTEVPLPSSPLVSPPPAQNTQPSDKGEFIKTIQADSRMTSNGSTTVSIYWQSPSPKYPYGRAVAYNSQGKIEEDEARKPTKQEAIARVESYFNYNI